MCVRACVCMFRALCVFECMYECVYARMCVWMGGCLHEVYVYMCVLCVYMWISRFMLVYVLDVTCFNLSCVLYTIHVLSYVCRF